VERCFERACRFLRVPLGRRQDGLWRIGRVPYEVRNVSPEFKLRFGPVYGEYRRFAFDKSAARRGGGEFVAPGHPLLEAVIDAVFARSREMLRRGAAFTDPSGRLDGVVWFLEGEVRDGFNAIASKPLFAHCQPTSERGGEKLLRISPAILWDLRPSPLAQCPDRDAIVEVALGEVLEPYCKELLQERQRDAEIKRKYGLRSLEQRILESEAKLIAYETRRAKGEEIPAATIQNEERVMEDLVGKKRRLETSIRRETTLTLAPPRILGVARVVPEATVSQDMRSDPEVEAIAMQVALEYERRRGRQPRDVSAENVGYDVRSVASDGAVRYIEVKGRASTGSIVLTPNEWLMAHRLGREYWLYVVEHCRAQPRLYTIQDPAVALEAEEVQEVVRYVVREWKEASRQEAG